MICITPVNITTIMLETISQTTANLHLGEMLSYHYVLFVLSCILHFYADNFGINFLSNSLKSANILSKFAT